MNLKIVLVAISFCGAATSALGQTAPEIAQGWRFEPAPTPSYVHSVTLMRCPTTLSDGYKIVSARVYQSSRDVSCGYAREGSTSVISFYWYPASGTAQSEIQQSSKQILARLAPGVVARDLEREWMIGGTKLKASSVELTDTNGLGQSFAIADIAGQRIKARETWQGDSAVSHSVADGFFATQVRAIANAKLCAGLPNWPTRRARLSTDPFKAAMTAGFIVATERSLVAANPALAAPPTCNWQSLGKSDRGSNLILSRTGADSVKVALDDQPPENFLAAVGTLSLARALDLPGDGKYALYSREGTLTSVFRIYRDQPSWEQMQADVIAVVTNALTPLVVAEPKSTGEGNSIRINTVAIDEERAKRRPGSQ